MNFAPATRADIESFYGPTRETIRAICAYKDGELVGIVGIAKGSGVVRFFSESRGLSCKELAQCWRAVKQAMQFVRDSKRPVYALAENDFGHKNLKRLGFAHLVDDVYLWGG